MRRAMPRRKAGTPAASNHGPSARGQSVRLVLPEVSIRKFVTHNPPKTMDLRAISCRAVKPNHKVFFASKQSASAKATTYMIFGHAMFKGNTKIRVKDLEAFQDSHQCSPDEIKALASNRDEVIGWEFEKIEQLPKPLVLNLGKTV